jgi:hypothetical protein
MLDKYSNPRTGIKMNSVCSIPLNVKGRKQNENWQQMIEIMIIVHCNQDFFTIISIYL